MKSLVFRSLILSFFFIASKTIWPPLVVIVQNIYPKIRSKIYLNLFVLDTANTYGLLAMASGFLSL